MAFDEILKGIVNNVNGGLAGMVMGMDGIPVDTYVKIDSGLDIQTMGVEYATIFGDISRISRVLKTGAVKEFSIFSERIIFIVRMITGEYFTVLLLSPDSNYGKGRYLLRKATPKLKNELES